MKKTLILEVGASGGSLGLYKINDQFTFTTNESALYDLLSEEDREGMKFQSKSKLFDSFDDAMISMIKKYPVFMLVPIEIDAIYKERIKKYFRKYFSERRYEEDFMNSRRKRWNKFLEQ